jgi:hypothetical protein
MSYLPGVRKTIFSKTSAWVSTVFCEARTTGTATVKPISAGGRQVASSHAW